ncbi:LysM peptidoglycan-binding domain-containing protein [Streptomyces tsukubensis]|uniref:LysM peptidoglycan-binding domain-containing protein n=1 Tax=Streptomyces tsukubensis TaxID=83656 RepID=UPI00277B5507|nr:transglycosylase family protein [Streptomyces tsukubensis]
MTGSAIAIPLLGATSASAADSTAWDRLAECESSGTWSANDGNGLYGGLQLSQESWEANGGLNYAPRADLASRSQQISVAEKVLADQGPAAWQSCGVVAKLTKGSGQATVDPGVTYPGDTGSTGSSSDGSGSDGGASASLGSATTPSPSASAGDSGKSGKSSTSDTSGKSDESASPSESASASESGKSGKGDGSGKSHRADGSSSSSSGASGGASASASESSGRHRGGAASDSTSDARDSDARHASRGGEDARGSAKGEKDSEGGKGGKAGNGGTYTVRAGDNLWDIAEAQKVDGGWSGLYEQNKKTVGSDPDLILPGQSLDLDGESGENQR